jgi:hypothetical protein
MGRRRRVEAVDAMPTAERQAFASTPEDIFVELFAQVFGIEKVNLLAHEYPVEEIYGSGRLIDYAIRTNDATFSTTHHSPLTTHHSPLTNHHPGSCVFRWTDRERGSRSGIFW